jgi:hypothetical protein
MRDKKLLLRTATPYVSGFLSSPFERLKVLINLFLANVSGMGHRDKGAGVPVD